jgi:hypothetical protein
MDTIVSVACILQQRDRGKYFDQTPTYIIYPASAYTHTHILHIRESPLLRYKLCNPLKKSCPTLNSGPHARIPPSEVSIYSKPSK